MYLIQGYLPFRRDDERLRWPVDLQDLLCADPNLVLMNTVIIVCVDFYIAYTMSLYSVWSIGFTSLMIDLCMLCVNYEVALYAYCCR